VIAGLVIGFVVGLLVSPMIRSWLTWREYVAARREARLHEETLRRMGPPRKDDRTAENPFWPIAGR
jgi:hypothetical protein